MVTLILLLTILNQVVAVQAVNLNNIKITITTSGGTNSSGSSKKSLRTILGGLAAGFAPIINFFAIIGIAKPNVIEIGSGEKVTVDIGLKDFASDGFINKSEDAFPFYMNARFLNFEVIQYPGNNSDGSWYVTFNPLTVQPKTGEDIPLKTQMTVSFVAPSNPADTIQSGILRVRIRDIEAMGSLWWPRAPNGTFTGNFAIYNSFFMKVVWFFGALGGGYGKYTGTIDTTTEAIVDILVKVKPYHQVRFQTSPLVQINPGQIASIPINVQNLGNYNDTFQFRVVGNYGKNVVSDPLSISLHPGEKQNTYLGVAFPPDVLDTGTIRSIRIETYSIDQPNVTIAQRTVFLETRGIYISELGGVGVLFFGIIIIVLVAFLLYRRRKILKQYGNKPEKPWSIPEKKQELELLRKEDKEKYNIVFRQMEDEYKSSLSSNKLNRKSLLKESRKKSLQRFTDLYKRPEKAKKVKTKKPKKKQHILSRTKQTKKRGLTLVSPFKKRQKEQGINKLVYLEKRRKEQAISSIKKVEEKDRRKYGNLKT